VTLLTVSHIMQRRPDRALSNNSLTQVVPDIAANKARFKRVGRPFTSLPCVQDKGGENGCIDTKDVLRLLIVSDSVVRLLVTLGARSAW
jgi:hypothetical protein